MNPWTREEILQVLALVLVYLFILSIFRADHFVLCSTVIHELTGREPDIEDMYSNWFVSRTHVFSCLSPLSLDMIRWLVTDHSVHNNKLKTSCDRE
jgi:hypothetical protein